MSSNSANYEILVIRPKEETKILKSNMTKKDAELEKADWEKIVFNSDAFHDPVPKLKIRIMGDD